MNVDPKAGYSSSVLLLLWLVASSTPLVSSAVLLCSPRDVMGDAVEGFSELMDILIHNESF